jgi:hypothetical protein
MASTVHGCGTSAALDSRPGPLGNATASSQGDSPIKTTGDGLLQGGSLRLGRSLLCTPDVASWPCTPRPCAAVGPQPPCPRTRNRAPQTSGGLQALSEKTRGVASVARCSAPDSLSSARGPVSSSTPAISAAASPSNGSGTTGRMSSGSARRTRGHSRSSRGRRCAVHPRCDPCYTATGGQLVRVSVLMRHHKVRSMQMAAPPFASPRSRPGSGRQTTSRPPNARLIHPRAEPAPTLSSTRTTAVTPRLRTLPRRPPITHSRA